MEQSVSKPLNDFSKVLSKVEQSSDKTLQTYEQLFDFDHKVLRILKVNTT